MTNPDPNTIKDDPHGPNEFHPHVITPPNPFPHRLGKKAPRPGAVPGKFTDYFDLSTLAAPPAQFGHDKLVGNGWGMLGNGPDLKYPDIAPVGDCAIADAYHQHILWCAEVGVAIPVNTPTVIDTYSAVTGYVPGDPSTDQGTAVADLLKYRLHTGIRDSAGNVHKIAVAVALEPGNFEQALYAAYYTDGVTLGITLPQAWMADFDPNADSVTWDKPKRGSASTILGGHAITLVAGGNNELNIVTWGTDIVKLTQAGYEFGSDETYAIISLDRFNSGTGLDINGVDYQRLRAEAPELAKIA